MKRNPNGLRQRLDEAEETIRAIRNGKVDAVVVAGRHGAQVFTLEGAGLAYRKLIESMNEGALTLATNGTILYANHCFAGMVGCQLEAVVGSPFQRFLRSRDRATLLPILRRAGTQGRKLQIKLKSQGRPPMPAQVSVHALGKDGTGRATVSMVVTDVTEARRVEELLRALTHRLVRAQELERGRVALELHDNITQLLCAAVFCSQALADRLHARDGTLKGEAIRLRDMLGGIADEIQRISHDLGPSVLNNLGLVAVLREKTAEFARRTGLKVTLAGVQPIARLPADIELALFRILQEALRNVEKHARASRVSLILRKDGNVVRLAIHDDGIGCGTGHRPGEGAGRGGLGLASMRERAGIVGGSFRMTSSRRTGTVVEVRVRTAEMPLAAG